MKTWQFQWKSAYHFLSHTREECSAQLVFPFSGFSRSGWIFDIYKIWHIGLMKTAQQRTFNTWIRFNTNQKWSVSLFQIQKVLVALRLLSAIKAWSYTACRKDKIKYNSLPLRLQQLLSLPLPIPFPKT